MSVETERRNSLGKLWDIGTDFNFAHNLNLEGEANQSTTWFEYNQPAVGVMKTNTGIYFASWTYFIISLPGIILGMRGIAEIMKDLYRRIPQ